jgi:hypothetical protein
VVGEEKLARRYHMRQNDTQLNGILPTTSNMTEGNDIYQNRTKLDNDEQNDI